MEHSGSNGGVTPLPPLLSREPSAVPAIDGRGGLARLVSGITALDEGAMAATRRRLDDLTKPLGSLGQLEETMIRLAGITGTHTPLVDHKCIVIMCADNGVTDEGVSSCPKEVTATVTGNFTRGLTGVNVFSRLAGSAIRIVDIGVASEVEAEGIHRHKVMPGTANMAKGPAMDESQALQAIAVGISAVETLKRNGCQLLGTGEMGIGNTSTSTAVTAVLTGKPVSLVVGRGSGLSDAALAHKTEVIVRAISLNRCDPADPLAVLARVGGLDIAGLVGCYLGAAIHRLPIVIDGFIAAAAALVAVRLAPACREFMFASHGSAEPGASHALEALGLHPMLQLGLRLGEGTGAALAFPLFDAALAAYYRMGSFSDAHIEAYQPQT